MSIKIVLSVTAMIGLASFSVSSLAASVTTSSDNQYEACLGIEPENNITPTAFIEGGVESKDYYSGNPKLFFVSLPDNIKPHGEPVFIFSPKHLRWAAYNSSGQLINSGVANGGSSWCRDLGRSCRTPRGVFRVHRKGPRACRSSKFPVGKGGAWMPHCVYFKGGYAVHGSTHIGGRNSSHGCIRVKTDKARWLYDNFFSRGTKVIVWPY